MGNLSKEFRELLEKTTQGEWFRDDQRNIVCTDKLFKSYTHSKSNADFIVKAHNDLPALLDELEYLKDLKSEHISNIMTIHKYDSVLTRYKKALEKCKEQRNLVLEMIGSSRLVRSVCDKEIEQILDGEEARDD